MLSGCFMINNKEKKSTSVQHLLSGLRSQWCCHWGVSSWGPAGRPCTPLLLSALSLSSSASVQTRKKKIYEAWHPAWAHHSIHADKPGSNSQRLSSGLEVGGIWEVAGLGLNPGFSIYTSLNLSFLILKMGATKPI